ncbi:MAG: IS21 family transposase, partial [Chloroflexi bacterium]|nr:IS21 family transposase [Chloroflexota bacterium]
ESDRRIARDLGMSRTTVRKYHQWADAQGYLQAGTPFPDDATLAAALGTAPRPPRVASSVEPHRELVQRLLDQGVEMTAIFQRLQDDYSYRGSYSSVRRYVHKLRPAEPKVVVRVHTAPGEETQVDFGSVGQLYDPNSGRARRAYVFVATLCYSRHQYAELVFDQKVPTWIALHRHAFESWGGVPKRVVPDNLKAAVAKVVLHDPVLGEAYRRLAQHYGFLISPTRPYTPRHKGKVENGVRYVKRNFMAGREFLDIHVANQRLKTWVQERAGIREHGTTHQAPLHLFHEYEQAVLLPLPDEAFTLREIRRVKVHPDCHVSIDKSYYSVPYAYVGQTLDAHIGERIVEIYRAQDLVATHERSQEPGHWHTRTEHYPKHKAAYLERTPTYCRQVATRLGPATSQVVETLLADRPLYRLRSVQAILRLEETVGAERLEAACARALHFGDPRHRRIKGILNAALDREPLPDTAPPAPARQHVFARSSAEFFDVQEVTS